MTDLLKRAFAPIPGKAWEAIDQEARRVLRLHLAGRKIVDFEGPHGWKHAAVNTGRLRPLAEAPAPEVTAGLRLVQPLVELRTSILLDMGELDGVVRGAEDPDLSGVVDAAERMARAEDNAIFNGFKDAGIVGIVPASPHPPVKVAGLEGWPRAVVMAKEILRVAGVGGPYALALGPRAYDEISSAAVDGYPVRKRIEQVLEDGRIVWAPALAQPGGAALVSMRGGDYQLTVGQDLSLGYAFHDRRQVELFLTESFTFRVLEPAAAVSLDRA